VHNVRFGKEAGHDLLVQDIAVCRATGVIGVVRGDVGGLATDSVRVAEIWPASLRGVHRHPLQQLGQLNNLRVLGRQCPPAIQGHQVAREDNLVPRPVWVPSPCTWHALMVSSCVRQVCRTQRNVHIDDNPTCQSGDESAVALAQVAAAEKAKVVYVYDFGDDWRHDIVVEKILPAEPGAAYPRCTGGRGETPAEDSGGIWSFNEERAQGGVPGGSFDLADVTEALADLAEVVTPAT
jgi:Plasmid pRiA4b ORF-3-like protein